MLSSLTMFSSYKGSLLSSLWREAFPDHCDNYFTPPYSLPSLFILFPPPDYIPTPQALEGAPSEQLMQQSQIPQYYAQQPWVPKNSSLSHAS